MTQRRKPRRRSVLWSWYAAVLLAGCSARCDGCSGDDKKENAVNVDRDGETEHSDGSLKDQLKQLRRGGRFLPARGNEFAEYSAWVAAVLDALRAGRKPDATPPDGFELLERPADQLVILAERSYRKRGAGALVLRPAAFAAPQLVVEASHTFFDEGTLELGLAAFQKTSTLALLINTVHRGGNGTEEERRRAALSDNAPSDVAHNATSFFAGAHQVLVDKFPTLPVVQLHGFSDRDYSSASAVVSAAGTTADAARLAAKLREVLEERDIRFYPDDVDFLGGTRNVQARMSRLSGAPFIHIEMAASLRKHLLADAATTARFVDALGVLSPETPSR